MFIMLLQIVLTMMMNNKKFPLQIAQWNEVAEEATERKILKRYKETLDQEVSGHVLLYLFRYLAIS